VNFDRPLLADIGHCRAVELKQMGPQSRSNRKIPRFQVSKPIGFIESFSMVACRSNYLLAQLCVQGQGTDG